MSCSTEIDSQMIQMLEGAEKSFIGAILNMFRT